MQRLILILCFAPIYFIGSAQNKVIDSLFVHLKNQKIDSCIYKAYVRIADAYADSSYDKSLIYFNKALGLAEKSSKRNRVAHVYHKIGSLYLKKGEFPKALENFSTSLEIHEFLNNKTGIGQLLNDIGLIYKTWGKYDKALENYLNALKIFDGIGDDVNGAMASNNIGQIFYYREEYEKSIVYFKKYLDVNNKNKTMRAVAGAANNIASAYLELNKLDDALDYYIRAMRVFDSLGIKIGVAVIKDNIGSLYIRKQQYNDALLYNSEASRIFEEVGSKSRLSASLQCVALAYSKLNKPDLAIINLTRSLEIALSLKQQETKKDIYETFAEVYTQTKQFEKALINYKLFAEIKDSLLNSETIEKIETIQAEYESQKKENDLIEMNQKFRNQKILGLLSAGIIVLFLFLTALIIRENQQKKKTIRIAEVQTKNLNQVIRKTNENLLQIHNLKVSSSSVFDNYWHISSSKENGGYCFPFFKDDFLILAFFSGNSSENEDLVKLSIFDFFNALDSKSFNSHLKEQYITFIADENAWHNTLSENQMMNIDFWIYNKDTKEQLYSGTISAYHVDNKKNIIDLSKTNNNWTTVEKGNRLYFCTSNNLNAFILNQDMFFQNELSKIITKSLDLSFNDQKEVLSNSLELIDAGSEQQFNISISGYLF